MFDAPLLSELAFNGSFEDGGAVTLKIRLRPFQGGDAGIKVREEFFDLGDDAALLVERRKWNRQRFQSSLVE
jgi:hypothetical protein